MLKLTKKGDYGLLLVTALAKTDPNSYIPLSQISKEYNIPYKFLTQIALALKSAGIIVSKEGVNGGYRLKEAKEKINVYSILVPLEGEIAPTGCMRGKTCDCQSHCRHRFLMQSMAKNITTTLKEMTLAQMIGE